MTDVTDLPDSDQDGDETEPSVPPEIAEGLRFLAVDIDRVRPQDQNARQGDVDIVRRYLRRFGQRKPITVTRDAVSQHPDGLGTGETSAGSTTLRAAIAEGMTEIAVVWFDDTPDEAKAWSLADNNAHDVGYTDQSMVEEMLAELAASPTPELVTDAGFDLASVLADLPEVDAPPPVADPPRPFIPGRKKNVEPEPDPDTPPPDDGDAPVPPDAPAPSGPQFPPGWPPSTFVPPPSDARPELTAEEIEARNAVQEAADRVPDDDGPVLFLLADLRATVDRAAFEAFKASLLEEIPDQEEAGQAVLLMLGFDIANTHIVRRQL